jgi:hypothetical protein
MKRRISFCLFISLIFFAACARPGVDSIQREDLFSLDIGPMEDQIALYSFEGDGGIRQAELAMKDGLFYISDSNGGKIIRYNSYGDLLFLIYNDETNPEPANLKPKTDNGVLVTRWAFTYPLKAPSKITVDSRKHIYVEERLPRERHIFDTENRVLKESVILHFDEDGRFIEYLGQGGQGGGPFPRIAGLFISAQDELAAACVLPQGWNIYWYNSQGEQLFLIQIQNNAIPAPPNWRDFIASIDTVIAAPDARKLYIKVDYYREIYDKSTNTHVSTEPLSTLIWIFNIDSGNYENYAEAPFYEYSYPENGRTATVRLLYSMLGLTRNGGILLYFPVETGYAVLRMDSSGHGQRRGFIGLEPGEARFNSFHLSPEGILSALLADEWKVRAAWWRMDRFMRGE